VILTSINAGPDFIAGIRRLAGEYDICAGDVVDKLAGIIILKGKYRLRKFTTVKYQADMPGYYKKFRVCFDEGIYESCQDFRKVFKLSVSRVLCEGFVVFYDELVASLSGVPRLKGCFHDSYYYAIRNTVKIGGEDASGCEYLMTYRRKNPHRSG